MQIADQEDVDSFVLRDVVICNSSNIIGVVQSGLINRTSGTRHTHVVGENSLTF